jgi:crotonobetaine/carnitine-CoA ligase
MSLWDLDHTENRNLGRILQLQAEHNGDTTFLRTDERCVSYTEAERMANSIARGLADLGVGKGDLVAFFMTSSMDVVFLTLAVNKLGAIWTPINTEYKGDWLRDILIDSNAKVIVSDTFILPRLMEVIDSVPHHHLVVLELDGDIPAGAKAFASLKSFSDAPHDMSGIRYGDVNAVLWTSGTTGKSKGVMQSHNIWIGSSERGNINFGTRRGDVAYNVLPLYNTASWSSAIFRSMVGGITCAMDANFSVTSFWDRIRYYGATQAFTLGAMHIYLWNLPPSPRDIDNPLRAATMVPMPEHLLEPFRERYGIETITQGFGQSEMSAVMSRTSATPGKAKPGSLGIPNPEIELRLIDDDSNDVPVDTPGEFAIKTKGPHMMFEGYFNNPEATANAFTPDGWYKMGDLGRRDADGDYFFVDRKKDAVRYAGRNISTMEVESAIRKHSAIHDVAVFGIRSTELADESELAAHVVLKPGETVKAEELARYINDNAPYYFVPRYMEFVTALPYTPTNKVQKYVLRERGVTAATWDARKAGFKATR